MSDSLETQIARQNWRYRAIEATKGNQSKLGCIVLAILGRAATNPPWFGPTCVITPDGYVLANFVDKERRLHEGYLIGDVEDFVGNLRGLADHLRLTDDERVEFFEQAQKWVAVDYRADPDYAKIRKEIANG